MSCNMTTREIKRNISKENLKNMPLQFCHSIFLFLDASYRKWNDQQNL